MARGDQILQPDLVREDKNLAAIFCPDKYGRHIHRRRKIILVRGAVARL